MNTSQHRDHTYDVLAPVYDTMMDGSQYYANIRVVEARMLANLLRDGKYSSLLDLGCGTGFAAVHAAKYGIFICGVDPSDSMLSLAASRLTECGATFNLIHASVESMPLDGDSYDVIVAFGSILNHMDDWDAFFRLVSARSRPGTHIIMTVDNVFGLDSITWSLYQMLRGNFAAYSDFRNRLRARRSDVPHYNKWILRVGQRGTKVHLKYESAHKVLSTINRYGFDLVHVQGVNCLASLCPSVVLSSEGLENARQVSTRMNRVLSKLDSLLSRVLWRFAGSSVLHLRKPME